MTREEAAIKLTGIWLNHRSALKERRTASDVVDNYNYNLKYMNGNFEKIEVKKDVKD